jgi:hypothetical protein
VNVNVAVAAPVLTDATLKVVLPHPVVIGVASDPNARYGTTSLIWSFTASA